MIQVRAPDGSIAQFPDGTPDTTIRGVMGRHYGAPPPPTPAQQRAQANAQATLEPPAAQQIVHGMTAGFDPEIAGGLEAARTGVLNFLGRGPGYGMNDAYGATSQAVRSQNAAFSNTHPGGSLALQLLGGFGLPGTSAAGKFVGGARSLPSAMARGAVVGAGYGAATGAGNAGPGQRFPGAMQGAIVGSVTGGAIPVASAAVRTAADKMSGGARGVVQAVQNFTSPTDPMAPPTAQETNAARQGVMRMMQAAKVTPETLASVPAVLAGKPITTAEAIGRTGVTQLAALARRSGTVGDDLGPVIADRVSQMPSRIQQDFASAAGIDPAAARGDIDGLVSKLQGEAAPLYKAALSNPGPVWNTDLASLAQRPVVKKAIAQVGQDALNAGQDPMAMGLQVDPDTGLHVLGTDKVTPEVEPQPTAQTWDAIKKAIGRQVERNPITGRPLPDSQSSGNYGVRIASQNLTHALAGDPANGIDGAIPGYRAALDKAGDYLSMQDAFDKGAKLITSPGVNENDFAGVYNDLDDPSQQAFMGGFANKLFDLSQNGRLNPGTFKAPRIQQKLTMVLGPDKASDFLNNVQLEGQLAATGQRMAPGSGSATMELGHAAGEQEAGPNFLNILHALHNPLGALKGLADAGSNIGTNPQVRSEMGRILMQDPTTSIGELKLLPAGQVPQPPSYDYGSALPAVSAVSAGNLLGN